TQGLFGIQFRPQRTPKNDITVSSTFGLSGTFALNTPGVDPSRGLAQLPTNVVDASQQIDQRCTPQAANQGGSFTVTGRGGIPPSPNDTLQAEFLITPNWVILDSEKENNTPPAPTTPTNSAPKQLVEAQGWRMNEQGQVVLTASAPNVTPHDPWQTPVQCPAEANPVPK
ncbi:MAG TPA: S-layer family protein, partial [Stenomitos sp.]